MLQQQLTFTLRNDMITIEYTKQAQGDPVRTQGWLATFRITSSSRTNTTKLFKIRSHNNKHFFAGVASPVDLIEMDEAPNADGAENYWISDTAEILVRCEADLDELVNLIKIDLQEFDLSLKNAANSTVSVGVMTIP